MLRLMKERPSLSVVNDQVGSPTYAADLAAVIMQMISSEKWIPGIYNYSNEGRISWFDFASEIRNRAGLSCELHPVPSSGYPTPAKRPSFSLLNKEKIQTVYQVQVPDWKDSLAVCLQKLL
jgi:dTDP-4-dehydrorhamnose reductase